jgi:hypothetical protein
MPSPNRFHDRFVACCLLATALLFGCGKSSGTERFVPAEAASRSALEAMLVAWRDGVPAGPVPNTKPEVFVTDAHRRPGQKLEAFEILGPVPGNAPRCFAVKVKLANPDAEERVRFVIVGIEPLWVFRQEDYDMLTHWEHPMPPADEATSPASATNSTDQSSGKP